jgi:hypothetical protein
MEGSSASPRPYSMRENKMAKKVAKKRGVKSCIHCGKQIAARSTACKFCGKTIPPKNPKPTGGKRTSSVDMEALSQLVKEVGGTDKLGKLIEMLDKAGGAEAVLSEVDRYEKMKSLFG